MSEPMHPAVRDMTDAAQSVANLTDHAFGWAHLKDNDMWRTHRCGPLAAE